MTERDPAKVTGQVRKWCVTFRGEAGLLAVG